MEILKRYLGLIFYFFFFIAICMAVDYFNNKILFDNLDIYYIILTIALAYYVYTYIFAAKVKIENGFVHIDYIPSFNRNKIIAISDIEEVRIIYPYLSVYFTFYLKNFKKVKVTSMSQTYKNDEEFKHYFESSDEFKTHKYIGKWKACKI